MRGLDVTPQSYDVAIVGYGPVGVTAANLLGQMGLRVVVVERDADIYNRARAISTDEEVLRIWQRIGLAERLKDDMLSDRPLDFVDHRGSSFLSFVPKPRGHGHPPQLFIYQPALERVLREGVERFPNVDVLLEHECLRVCQAADHVELMLADLHSDEFKRLHATYVIAADGGSSPTRGQLGIGFEGKTYEDRWVVIDTEVVNEWPTHDRLRFHCDPVRPAVDCPTPLGHHRWEFPVLPGEDEKELVSPAAVWRLLERQGITEKEVKILRAVVYSHHVRFADRWQVGRIFLAGDAAHVMPPWIGEGMASGIRDVANLCWKLHAVITGALPESLLESYAEERKPHVREMTSRAVFFGRVITERRKLVTAVRNPVFRLSNKVPFLGTYMREFGWFPKTYFSKGFRSPRRHKAVGWQIPQPWVLAGDGNRARLDDAIGDQWTLLHLGQATSWHEWTAAGVTAIAVKPAGSAPRTPDQIVDLDGALLSWMKDTGATAVAVRPDGYVYAAAGVGQKLPPPPTGLRCTRSPGALADTPAAPSLTTTRRQHLTEGAL
ncbi:bifunctional 3-(3-hydroxy-phenyl)propionate/3-hydroxycinnamic acid hydroxylase MhpA [Rhodococcus opacus]|uniref:bifunctional 3-(3-hydroxy-phenyl)propionate/3-hydroxycinnamic acid hydroxylase MhpA n=1 Tax=Rhodococcus opacus TaxID=37919 RepID=UPI001C4590EC|nr:bifunctional 3-(3-hydroxy-phenyl)propionate/3-hydroxycinnamic acid hydroxylase [Rhodococcus opacus]MBV6762299.1 bifunctional 3-(3-hydroxy-phenyl)propionate/3-hydroxycinnamic acid hydroxylase [Rhodococcus opacus]